MIYYFRTSNSGSNGQCISVRPFNWVPSQEGRNRYVLFGIFWMVNHRTRQTFNSIPSGKGNWKATNCPPRFAMRGHGYKMQRVGLKIGGFVSGSVTNLKIIQNSNSINAFLRYGQ